MAPSQRDRLSVDLHGLKAALIKRAEAERVSVSVLVRRTMEEALGQGGSTAARVPAMPSGPANNMRLSIRLTNDGAAKLEACAMQAGLSRGAFITGLLAQVPVLSGGAGSRVDCVTALTASNAELATLSRNLNHLTLLLRQGDVQAAKQYRQMLDTLGDEVRAHLRLAASALAELRPAPSQRFTVQGSAT
jgi:hypothetical protein